MMKEELNFLLRRTKSDENVDRFYSISLTHNLMGFPGVLRTWGRKGSWGQTRLDWYDGHAEACLAIGKLLIRKQKRGYLLV